MASETYELLIRAGRVICPATGRDATGSVAVRDGKIVGLDVNPAHPAQKVLDFPDSVLLPGLIDLHAHPSNSNSRFGVPPDPHLLSRGTTTVLSQGDAGAEFCEAYVRETIEASTTRVRLAINLSAIGEAGPMACFEQLDTIDVPACVASIERFREHVWGIAVNTSHHACGATDPREVLRRGLLVAEESGLPLLYGLRRPEDWPLEEQLNLLRSGDVVTYCFRRTPHNLFPNGKMLPAVREARARGVLFDVGHGCGSFDFAVAEGAIQDGFLPDTISTDLQRGHLGQTPVHDLPLVMSKLRAAGMREADIFAAVTSTPARILRMDNEIGELRRGARADLTLLEWNGTAEPLSDTSGKVRPGGQWNELLTLRDGKVVHRGPNQS